MNKQISSYFPSKLEAWGVAFLSLLILIIGNAHDMLVRYGMIQSSQVVKNQLANGVGTGLGKLDSFSATRNVVSFALWGFVGLFAFSIVQAVLRVAAHRKFEKELSSNHYIHPTGFDPNAFWKSIVIHGVVSFVLIVLAATGLILFLVKLMPESFRHARKFLLDPGLHSILNLLVGLAILFAGTWVVYTLLRLAYRQHRFNTV